MGLPEYLSEPLRAGLSDMGVQALFPVQAKVYPHVLAAHHARVRYDVCVCSPTGSGKTLGYTLPIVAALSGRTVPRMRCMIVVPRKELGEQVFKTVKTLADRVGLVCQAITGKDTLHNDQKRFRDKRPDIVVATPSRLVEMMTTEEAFDLGSLRFLVLDEADILLSDATQDWLRTVLAACRETPDRPLHRLLLSATLTHNMAKLGQVRLKNPKQIMLASDGQQVTDVKRYAIPSTLSETVVRCKEGLKLLALRGIIEQEPGTVLVFTKSIESAHRLTRLLQLMGAAAEEFSGQLTTAQRALVVKNLREGTSACAVCSDALARGMDLDSVSLVVNYELPSYIQTYVHRVGRTARAGREGRAVTLVEDEDEEEEFTRLRKRALIDNALATTDQAGGGAKELPAMLDACLAALQTIVAKEKKGHLSPTAPVPKELVGGKPEYQHLLMANRKRIEALVTAGTKRRRGEDDDDDDDDDDEQDMSQAKRVKEDAGDDGASEGGAEE